MQGVVLPGQRILVSGCVDGVWVGIVEGEVEYPGVGREGRAFLAGRLRRVIQRYPLRGSDFDWVVSFFDGEGIEPSSNCD